MSGFKLQINTPYTFSGTWLIIFSTEIKNKKCDSIRFYPTSLSTVQVERIKSIFEMTPCHLKFHVFVLLWKLLYFFETDTSYKYRNGIKPFIKEQTKNELRSPVEKALLCSAYLLNLKWTLKSKLLSTGVNSHFHRNLKSLTWCSHTEQRNAVCN